MHLGKLARLIGASLVVAAVVIGATTESPRTTVSAAQFSSGGYTTSAAVTPGTVTPGSVISISASVTSQASGRALVDLEVYSPAGVKLYQTFYDRQRFSDGQTRSYSSTWTVPANGVAGTYTVSLTVTGPGGSDSETKTGYIVVGQLPPIADFSGTPLSGIAPLSVSFSDLSNTGGPVTSWSWDFGDSTSSTAQNPSHTYTNPGSYQVSLTATGPGGSDTRVRSDYVVVSYPPPNAQFFGSPLTGVAHRGLSCRPPQPGPSWPVRHPRTPPPTRATSSCSTSSPARARRS